MLIDSTPGDGTVVRVYFPATSEVAIAAESDNSSSRRPLRGQGETILLAEDEVMVREPARRLLTRNGYRVLAAASGEQALEILRAHPAPVDLLLTDVIMPGKSGKDLADEVAVLSPATEVVFMSGYSEDVIAHQGVLDPGLTFMQKPFSAAALLRTVRRALDGALQ